MWRIPGSCLPGEAIAGSTFLSALENDSATVEDFMTKEVISFDQQEDLIAVCECLIKNHFRRIPIVSQGKLTGIISRRDIIKYILEPIG